MTILFLECTLVFLFTLPHLQEPPAARDCGELELSIEPDKWMNSSPDSSFYRVQSISYLEFYDCFNGFSRDCINNKVGVPDRTSGKYFIGTPVQEVFTDDYILATSKNPLTYNSPSRLRIRYRASDSICVGSFFMFR